MRQHFPEGEVRARTNLHNPEETVMVKAPGADIDVSTVTNPAENRSRAVYGFVNKETGEIVYVGKATTKQGRTDGSIERAVLDRLNEHVRQGTFDPETQAVIVLDAQATKAQNRGAEQFFYDVYNQRGTLTGNTNAPLDSVKSTRRVNSVNYLNEFFRSLGYENPNIRAVVDVPR
jgi:hypothetical protein